MKCKCGSELVSKNEIRQAKCLACQREHARKYFSEKPWMKALARIRGRCGRGGQKGYVGIPCPISAADIKFLWDRDRAGSMMCPSVDRIIPELGYTKDNCRFIEHRFNSAIRRNNKLSGKDIIEIRRLRASGKSAAEISRMFNVARQSASEVARGDWGDAVVEYEKMMGARP